jgi:hypothetical protein
VYVFLNLLAKDVRLFEREISSFFPFLGASLACLDPNPIWIWSRNNENTKEEVLTNQPRVLNSWVNKNLLVYLQKKSGTAILSLSLPTRSHDPVPLITCILLFITDGDGRGGADSRKSDGGHAWYRTQHRGIPLKLLRDAPVVPVLRTWCTQWYSALGHSSQTSS